ncbi:MAG TPA: hypothetical protein DDW87_08215 [Firmicutes bacterium]|nr:hypothetical protein [Bacillota bacterium]
MLRVPGRLLVLGAILVLLSGSFVVTNPHTATAAVERQAAMESLLAQQDEDLAGYSEHLRQAGEDIFAEKQGELRRARAQKLHNDARALQAQIQLELKELQDELGSEILRQQLQLMLVSLDKEEQQARLGQIEELQEQIKGAQASLEEDYQEKLDVLQAEHERRGTEELLALQMEVERAMEEELVYYSEGLLRDLEEEIAKINTNLRSRYANR